MRTRARALEWVSPALCGCPLGPLPCNFPAHPNPGFRPLRSPTPAQLAAAAEPQHVVWETWQHGVSGVTARGCVCVEGAVALEISAASTAGAAKHSAHAFAAQVHRQVGTGAFEPQKRWRRGQRGAPAKGTRAANIALCALPNDILWEQPQQAAGRPPCVALSKRQAAVLSYRRVTASAPAPVTRPRPCCPTPWAPARRPRAPAAAAWSPRWPPRGCWRWPGRGPAAGRVRPVVGGAGAARCCWGARKTRGGGGARKTSAAASLAGRSWSACVAPAYPRE